MPVILRLTSPTAADLADINALLAQLAPDARALTLSQLDDLTAAPTHDLLITRGESGRIVGMTLLVVAGKLSGVQAWIEDVAVDAVRRNRGLGEALVKAAVETARLHGASCVDLTSRPEREAANRLYGRLGFERRQTNVWRKKI